MAEALNLDDLISQAEAAELRGVTRASINELVKRGRLRSVEIAGRLFLYRSEVENFEPQSGGRPPKSSKPNTIETQTKTTRRLNQSVKREADKEMGGGGKGGKK